MKYMLIRRTVGTMVIICGAVSGICVLKSAWMIGTVGNIFLSKGSGGLLIDSANSINVINSANLFLKGLAFGIFGICLALGSMVFKIGSGKESITLNLKEDRIEATVKGDESPQPKQRKESNHIERRQAKDSGKHEIMPGEQKLEQREASDATAKHLSKRRKRMIATIVILLLLNIGFVIWIYLRYKAGTQG